MYIVGGSVLAAICFRILGVICLVALFNPFYAQYFSSALVGLLIFFIELLKIVRYLKETNLVNGNQLSSQSKKVRYTVRDFDLPPR